MNKKLAERFLNSFIKDEFTGCWNWNRRLKKTGYGRFVVQVIEDYAHRVAYKLIVGEIPKGLSLDHLCQNKKCVNPDHLEPVTPTENTRRASVEYKICKRGHPKTPENVQRTKTGKENCKLCKKMHTQKTRAKKARSEIYEW